MKKTIKLAMVATLALGATSAFATNGSALIGEGAITRGMAGVGIGMSHGAESALVNPALITSVEGSEVSFGGTIFMPSVSSDTGLGGGSKDSQARLNIIPEVSLATKVNDYFYWGVGMWGTAGMGTDYNHNPQNFKMVTNLQLMQFGVPLAFKIDGLSLAVTPLLQYGSLDINYNMGTGNNGAGVAQSIKFGYDLGASYEISGFTIGLVYKSQINMQYRSQISNAMQGFGVPYTNDVLSTPAEAGIGVSYKIDKHNTIAFDWKEILWSSARGYKDFKWKDQDVFVVGYEYASDKWAARAGYNYAKSPISDQGTGAAGMGGLINTFNLLGFPAIVESHFAVGGSYNFSKQTSVDLAYTYAIGSTDKYPNAFGSYITTKHSQNGISVQLDYKF